MKEDSGVDLSFLQPTILRLQASDFVSERGVIAEADFCVTHRRDFLGVCNAVRKSSEI